MRGPLSSGLNRRPLLTAVVFTGIGVLPLFLISAQILQIGREIDFGVSRLGLATAAFFGSAALAANGAGAVVARIGPKNALRLGSGLTVVSCLVAAAASNWWMVPVAMVIGGVANGTIQVAANIAIFGGVRVGRQGLAFGSKQAAVPMASVIAGLSLPLVGSLFGWRWVFFGAALMALIISLSVPDLTYPTQIGTGEVMGRPPRSLVFMAVAGFSGAVAGNGISLFIVPSAVGVGFDEPTAGFVLSFLSVLVVGVRVGAGWMVDRRESSGLREMIGLAGAGAIGGLILVWSTTPALYLLAMSIAVLGAWGWPGVFFFAIVRRYSDFPAKATGLVLSGNLAGTLIGPVVVGALASDGDFQRAWLFVSAAAATAVIGFLLSYREGLEGRD
jgi:MFS family permease